MAGNGPILIIGGNMFLGQLVRRHLATLDCSRRILDQSAVCRDFPGEEPRCGDLENLQVLLEACQDIETVIDLSRLDLARTGGSGVGIANFWEAARISGVKRVITFQASGTVGFYRRSSILDHLTPPRPDGPLGVLGATTEATASLYAFKFGIRTLCVRMGDCWAEPLDERMLSTWISPSDFERLVTMALSADYLYEIVYGVSANAERWWDNSNARRLGYKPLDNADTYAEVLRGRRSANSIENAFQGGKFAAAHFSGDPRRIP
jgi:uronate dehydrogenase